MGTRLKKGISVNGQSREIIYNVYKYFSREAETFKYLFKELPNLKNLRLKLIEAINFKGSTVTLRKILRKMGFWYCKTRDNRKTLMEKHDVRLKRTKYLDKIKISRNEGSDIVYMDESYIHTNAGIKKPISKGQRLIIAHAGSENGFVPGALLVYKSTDTTGDYHKEMNSENYEKWVKNQLIPNLPTNSVLVVDNAPYHNKYTEKLPNSNTREQDMIDWLTTHNIPVDPNEAPLQYKHEHIQYSIDKILAEHGHSVLRLPPYHPDFNPIENIWAQLKQYVAQRNVDMTLTSVKNLLQEKVNMIGPEDWKKYMYQCECCLETFNIPNSVFGDSVVLNLLNGTESVPTA
ncbi:uncharacterized protein LOC134743952 [Cydia strobilella]|uniref:uncharacterized protein LOC134743952 n=1 Tax=Cydia strobilella TaxID=1100964 RepID=UPI0030044663